MQLEQQELETIKALQTEFAKAKMSLGDLELSKNQILKSIEAIKQKFDDNELKLVEKYGANAVINIQTGEVTQNEG
jgi:hypothetical protein